MVLSFRKTLSGKASASIPEAKKIMKIVRRHKPPIGVRTWDFEFGQDAAGQPAVWVWFYVNDDEKMRAARIKELNDFRVSVMSGLFDENTGRTPYVGFRDTPQ